MKIIKAADEHAKPWAQFRHALWPEESVDAHEEELSKLFLSRNPDRIAFIALDHEASCVGFSEASLRRDFVEGCRTSPVAFLEGIYVAPDARGTGIGRALNLAVENWAKGKGYTELASNALLDNEPSHAFHSAIGFAETLRLVFFRKSI